MIAPHDIQTEPDLGACLRMRHRAEALLNRLMKNRIRTEQYHTDQGTTDPMRSVTGHSAIDNAIDHTREILRNLDRVLQSEPKNKFETDCGGLSRLRERV